MATGVKKKKKATTKKRIPRARVLPLVPTPSHGEQALYLYGVSPAEAKAPEVKMLGIDGEHGVEAIPCGDFLCWVTPVNAHEFAAELARKMEELEWLAESSVRHQRVVAAIAAKTTLLPARFGTIFLSHESLSDDVESRAALLAAAFGRVKDADEWGVKVFLTAPSKPALVSARSGKDYLQKKAKAIAAERKAGPDEEVNKLAAELQKVTRARAVSNKVSSGQQGLQWQSSYLLPRAKRKQWDAVLLKYARRWADSRRIEASGPWPPYSFVE
jgi:hypothetical protein